MLQNTHTLFIISAVTSEYLILLFTEIKNFLFIKRDNKFKKKKKKES